MIGLAQIAAILLLSESAAFAILATLDGSDLVKDGIDAQAIYLPPAVAAEKFAEQVVEAEHLKAWNDGPMAKDAGPGLLGYRAVTAGSGRSVVVYFARVVDGPRVVCRLRTKGNTGLSDARYRAIRCPFHRLHGASNLTSAKGRKRSLARCPKAAGPTIRQITAPRDFCRGGIADLGRPP
eukprot:gene60070-82190_t